MEREEHKKIAVGINKLTKQQKESALKIFKYFVKMYAHKSHTVSLSVNEDIFTHFAAQFCFKFIFDNKLDLSFDSVATANNACNYANMEIGSVSIINIAEQFVSADDIKPYSELKEMKEAFSTVLTNTTADDVANREKTMAIEDKLREIV